MRIVVRELILRDVQRALDYVAKEITKLLDRGYKTPLEPERLVLPGVLAEDAENRSLIFDEDSGELRVYNKTTGESKSVTLT